MRQYLEQLDRILSEGNSRGDRTGAGTISLFGDVNLSFDLSEGFPLQTTKKVSFKNVAAELLWFLSGDTRVDTLVRQGVNIWVGDWLRIQKKRGRSEEECQAMLAAMKDGSRRLSTWEADLPFIYGRQWRDFHGVDQIRGLLDGLKSDPYSRRHVVSAWNASDLPHMALPPCHTMFQMYVEDSDRGRLLSCKMYQRSADWFLGVPYNIASYALLTHLVAHHVGYVPHKLYLTFGDAHVYRTHLPAISELVDREPRELPRLVLNQDKTDLFQMTLEDMKVEGYDPHTAIKARLEVGTD